MNNINNLLNLAINETDHIYIGEKFLLKDLFKGYEWNRIPRKDRLLLGTLFLNWVHSSENNKNIKTTMKTSSNQQQYEKEKDKENL